MGSQLFGPLDKDSDIRVGYIDGDNGFVEGLSVCEANEIARKDPGRDQRQTDPQHSIHCFGEKPH